MAQKVHCAAASPCAAQLPPKACHFAAAFFEAGRFGMASAASGLRHPASASCLGRHSRLAGRCPNNSSLFPPLAAVVVVAVAGCVESRGREGGVGTPLPASGPAERPCTLTAGKNFPRGAERISNRPAPGGLHHKIRCFLNAVLRKVPLLQRHPPGGKIRVACALPRL